MKLKSISTFVLLYITISSIFFIPPIQSTLSHTSLLDQICRQSPHYHLCVMTLQSSIHHRSKEDIIGFARLALHIVNANASATLQHAHKLYVQTKDPQVKWALEGCLASYNMIVKVHLREALTAINNGEYKVVKQKTYAAGIQASSCSNKFKNQASSPLRDSSRYMYNLCAITVSIVDRLLQPN